MLQVEMRYSAGEKYAHRASVELASWESANSISAMIAARHRLEAWAQEPGVGIDWRPGRPEEATDATVYAHRGVFTFRVWVRG